MKVDKGEAGVMGGGVKHDGAHAVFAKELCERGHTCINRMTRKLPHLS